MNQDDPKSLLNSLLQQDASRVRGWVEDVLKGNQRAPDGFNWLGLAEGTALRAYQVNANSADASPIEWARVATMIYEYLANEADETNKESLLCSSMMLRALMISKLGAISRDPLLDLEKITCWFFNGLELLPEVAAQNASRWRELPLEDVRALRRIKNRLAVINLLSTHEAIRQNQELQSWLAVRNNLP